MDSVYTKTCGLNVCELQFLLERNLITAIGNLEQTPFAHIVDVPVNIQSSILMVSARSFADLLFESARSGLSFYIYHRRRS